MARRLKTPVEKTCPKCETIFITDKPRRFCSASCSQSRQWTPEQKQAKSIAKRKAIMADTEAAEEERWRILKNKKIPPPIIHPDDLRLGPGQFVAGGEIWTEVNDGRDWGDGFEYGF